MIPTVKSPSPRWTDEERKEVALALLDLMEQSLIKGEMLTPMEQLSLVRGSKHLLTQNSAYLEANREALLAQVIVT